MDQWPDWWKYVKKVEYIKTGVNGDIGSIRRIKWGTALPYSLSFNTELLAVDTYKRIQGSVFGELEGKGIWTFTSRDQVLVHVQLAAVFKSQVLVRSHF